MSGVLSGMVRYCGLSMWPYFQDGDLLEVVPTTLDQLGIGDCVVLRAADGTLIAHRVVSLRHGLRTRGDALARDDDHQAAELQLVGRIVARHRLGRRSLVTGGRQGWLLGRFFYVAGRIDPQRQGRGGQLGRAVRGVCAPVTGPVIHRLMTSTRNSQGQNHAATLRSLGRFVVAHRRHADAEWQIRWPWRLFVATPPLP